MPSQVAFGCIEPTSAAASSTKNGLVLQSWSSKDCCFHPGCLYIFNPITYIYICIYQTFYHVGSILDLSFLLGFHPFLYVCRLHPHLFSGPLLSERAEPKNVGKSVGHYCWEVTCRMVIKHGGLGYRHTFILFVHTCSYYASKMSCTACTCMQDTAHPIYRIRMN